MKINVKFEKYLITIACENLESTEKYSMGKKDNSRLYLINFRPSGEPEASICCVAKGSK
jgi:hypothetical protein